MNRTYKSVWCEKTGNNTAIGLNATTTGYDGVALGSGANATYQATALGRAAAATANNALAVGWKANATGTNASAMGTNAQATAANATAIGGSSIAGNNSVSVGNGADSSAATWGVAVGVNSKVSASQSSAYGNSAVATANYATALGTTANASAANSVALGAGSTTTANLTTAGYNPGNTALSGTASTANGEVSVGKSGSERRITNVAAGAAATDAVNVSQLQSEDAKLNLQGTTTASGLGGGATYNSTTGAVSAPSYLLTNANSIAGTSGAAADVGTGFSKVDAALGTLNTWQTNVNNGGGIKYFHANSSLADSNASGANSVAIGPAATASSGSALAIGNGATANSGGSIQTASLALGAGATATATSGSPGDGAIAIGANAQAVQTASGGASGNGGNIALGVNANATGSSSWGNNTVIGHNANASVYNGTAVGSGAKAGLSAQAIGDNTTASATGSLAVGTQAASASNYAIAEGSYSSVDANSAYATVIGNQAKATNATNSVAIGSLASVTAANSVALGAGSTTTANLTTAGYNPGNTALAGIASAANGEVSVGKSGSERRITNVAAGAAATDAVNVSQLQSEDTKLNLQGTTTASGLGGGSTYNNTTGAVSAPSYALTNANAIAGTSGAATNVGSGFSKVDAALGTLNTEVAGNTTAINNIINSGAIGLVQQSAAGENLTVGKNTDGVAVDFAGTAGARKLINVADGAVAADSKDAVNGSQLFATNEQVAQNTADIAGNTTSITNLDGRVTNVEGDISTITNNINSGSIGLVQQSAAGENLTVGKDTDGAAVDFAGTAGARKLINVADGAVVADSKEAVNGSQLFATNEQVAQNTADIAGNTASISDLDGRVTINEGSITNLDGRVTNVEGDISTITNNINSGSIGLVQQSAAGENLTVGKDTDGAAVDFAGTAGARKLINVADGAVAADSKDAVNGSQLFATNEQVAQNTADIAGNTASISDLDGRVTINEGSITNLDQRVTTNEGDISTLNTNVSNIDARTTQNTTDISSINTTINNMGDVLAEGSITNLDQRVTTNEGDISTLNTNVSNIDARVTQNTTDIAGNTTSITNLDGRVTNVEGDISTITNNINSGAIGLVQQSAAGENLTVGKDTDGAAVDFAGTAGARKLINVADGAVAADSKDAVNGGQLFGVSQSVANAIGGGSVVNEDGSISAPTYTVTNVDGSTSTINNVGDAITNIDSRTTQNSIDIAGNTTSITNLDGRVTNVEGDISTITNNINSGAIGLVQQSAAGENLTVGKDTDGAAVDFAGTAGARKLINVADGAVAADSKDAVNGGQLFGVSQSVANAIGGGSVVNEDGSVSAPTYTVTNVDGSTSTVNNMGDAISNIDARTTQNSTDINTINTTISNMGDVLGNAVVYDSAAHDKITLGTAGKAVQLTNVKAGKLSADSTDAVNGAQLFETNNNVAMIDGRVTTLEGSVTNIVNGGGIKYFHTSSAKADAVASGADAIAMGGKAVASGEGSVALGDSAEASAKGSVALGQGASDNGRGAESYTGKYSGAANTSVGTVSVGNAATGETRTVSNVADGKEATDAVNLRQLDGAVATSKSYTDSKVSGITDQVNSSISNVDNRVTQVEDSVSNIGQVNNTAKLAKPKASGTDSVAVASGAEASGASSTAVGSNAKAKGKNSVAIGANSVAERDNSVAVGSAGSERQITHLAAGTERSDAVNLGQVSDALSDIAQQTNSQYDSLKRDMHEQDDRLSAGIAGAIAIASLPQPMVNGGSTTSAGIGNFNGQSAVSVGVSHTSNDGKWTTKIGGSVDTQNNFSVGAGVGYNW